MRTYLVTACLVFGFVSYVFYQDDEAHKDDVNSWLFIAFAASIWPVTLPNMIRKVVSKWLKTRNSPDLTLSSPSSLIAYETSSEHFPR